MTALPYRKPFAAYVLQFAVERAAFAFPCDVQGQVDMDMLDEHARNDYFFARVVTKLRPESIDPAVVCPGATRTKP